MKTSKTSARFAVITFEDTILWDSDDIFECLRILELWEGFVRGIYDYEKCMYLIEV